MPSKEFLLKDRKVGMFTDLHLGLGQDSKQWHDVALNFAKWASKIYLDKGINDIIISGDVFHSRTDIGVNTLAVAKEFFDYFKDFRIFISSGNHDSFFKNDSTVNSISILDGWNNIHIIDKEPEILKYKDKTISLIPWGTTIENIPKCDICIGHFEISSFYMTGQKVCDHGFESKNLFNKSPFIISGHFHSKQHRTYNNGQILYLGSAWQHNFGDCSEERGIYIFDLENETFDFIENNISPKHYKVSVKELTENTDFDKSILENNIISLIVDTKIDQDELILLASNIQKDKPLSLRTDYKDVDLKISENGEEKNFDTGNLLQDIETFVNELDIEHKTEVIEQLTEYYKLLSHE